MMASIYQNILVVILVVSFSNFLTTNADSITGDNSYDDSLDEQSYNSSNNSVPQDLYVIKTIVYEVGILTDAANDTDYPSNDTQEQVDVSFFNPSRNGSVIDLSNIPLPIQTNVSGVSVTGILPSNLGSVIVPPNGTADYNGTLPLLPNKQVRVTHNISTVNPDKGSQILSNLPQILGLDKILTNSSKSDDESDKQA